MDNNLLTRHSRFHKWYPVTVEELTKFIGVTIIMGLIQVSEIEQYWSTSPSSFCSRAFSRNLFELSFWMLYVSHVPPNETPRQIHKIQFLLDAVISNFKGNMHPSRNLSVDETMVGFRRRFGAKQYIPTKPNKYGIKAFTLAN